MFTIYYCCLWFINMHIFMNTFGKWSIAMIFKRWRAFLLLLSMEFSMPDISFSCLAFSAPPFGPPCIHRPGDGPAQEADRVRWVCPLLAPTVQPRWPPWPRSIAARRPCPQSSRRSPSDSTRSPTSPAWRRHRTCGHLGTRKSNSDAV